MIYLDLRQTIQIGLNELVEEHEVIPLADVQFVKFFFNLHVLFYFVRFFYQLINVLKGFKIIFT